MFERATVRENTPASRRALNERMCALQWPALAEYHLVCECGEARCAKAMRMHPSEYEALRLEPTVFAVIPGHERAGRDELLLRTDGFVVVRISKRAT